ncbi:hypothetical protein HU200_046755 [Digitaria exilis]|uniref:F-box domain-containing protein n=1 Tax=Digitaria exilis TaxID=1010633 RepID=A0A835EDP2_9POAL|nr:hypothetical protein HU200_046755 [Digitaria exilis]
MRQRKRRCRRAPEYMSEEMIREIMVWLPVKSLLRFRSVCKGWQAIISDGPVFILEHLHCSTSKWEQDPSVLISPHTLDFFLPGEHWPSTFSNHIHFYQWRPSNPRVAKARHQQRTARGLLRLDLSDESFTITALPDAMGNSNACIIDELRGELCLTARCSETTAAATVWAMEVDDEGRQGQWERRYSVLD